MEKEELDKELAWVKSKFINKAHVAKAVLGDKKHSPAYFQNKMNNTLGKKFSQEELKKLREVKKLIINTLL